MVPKSNISDISNFSKNPKNCHIPNRDSGKMAQIIEETNLKVTFTSRNLQEKLATKFSK